MKPKFWIGTEREGYEVRERNEEGKTSVAKWK